MAGSGLAARRHIRDAALVHQHEHHMVEAGESTWAALPCLT